MTGLELAIEFTDIWNDLNTSEINTMLARNVSMDLLEFFASYADEFADELAQEIDAEQIERLRDKLPNLLIIGYIIRVLEERLT